MVKWILLIFSLPLLVQAFSIASDIEQGSYWPTFPIKMQVVVPTDDGGQLLRVVLECEQQWEDSLGMDIWDIRAAVGQEPNTIYWEDDFGSATGYNPNGTLALTIRYQQGGQLSRVQIILNGSVSTLRQNWSGVLKKTLLHELGHTIGLGHSEEAAIMQPYIGNYDHLMDDDIAGAAEVIDLQKHRQAVGYLSPLSSGQEKMVSCGTINFTNNNSGGFSQLSFVFSLLLGLLPLIYILERGRKKFLPALG